MADQHRSMSTRAWSDLPPEIISKVETRLDSAIDLSQLRTVCKNWRSSRNQKHTSILSSFLPLIISNVCLPFTDRANTSVVLIARAVFLVKPLRSSSSSCGWLLTVEEMVPGKLRILYPLSNDHIKHLPSNFPIYLDLSKFRVSQVAKSYGFKYESDGKDIPDIRRVVLSSLSTVMVLFGGGALIGIRLSTGNWSYIRHSITNSLLDVVSYGENYVRAIDFKGNVYLIDDRVMKVVKTFTLMPYFDGSYKVSLIRSRGELFAAACFQKSSSTEFKFVIYELDEVQCKWINVGSTKCCFKVLFISSDWSFFVYPYELNLRHYSPNPNKTASDGLYLCWHDPKETMSGDYVIYSEGSFGSSHSNTKRLYEGAGLDLRISVFFFSNEDVSFWNELHRCSSRTINVLWPPPTWFWPDIYSSTREDEDADIHIASCSKKKLLPSYMADTSTTIVTTNKQEFTDVGNSNALKFQFPKEEDSRSSFQGIKVQSILLGKRPKSDAEA